MSESKFAKKVLPEWQKEHPDAFICRNNTGMAWQGKITWAEVNGKMQKVLTDLRPIFFGIGFPKKDKKTNRTINTGGGDCIGFESMTIAEIVTKYQHCSLRHKKIAVFLNLELKTKNVTESEDQKKFREFVTKAGGISEILKEE